MVNRNATVRTMPSFRDDYDFQMDMEDVDLMMNSSDYIPIPDQENVGTAYIRISLPELNVQKCLQFQLGESIWHAKQQILASFGADLRDGYNYGLYYPPQNGKAGKFLDEERLLREYPLTGPIGYLEFKFKRRVYRSMELNTRKLKQIHTKANLKQFMDAVKHANKEKVDKYVTKGLDPNYVDIDSGESPLTLSCTLSPEKCRSMIITLVSGGAHMDFRNRHGFTPIHKSALTSNSEAIKTLLDLGASPNYKDLRYLTPLYYAVTKDDPVCSEMLLNERAVIGTTDEQGWFEIHQACRSGKVQALEHLIYYGADMDVQNASGNTPLHVCAVTNQESCARVLLFRGANKVIVNLNNQTPYEAAIIAGNLELAEIIKGHSSAEIVPFREIPQYSNRRKLINYTANFRTLAKCRSETRLNLSMMDSRFFDPDGSFRQYSTSSDCYSVTNSDSPRSMSSSSIYSGPANNGGSGSSSNTHPHHHPHQRQKQSQHGKPCSRRRLYAALPNRVFICTKKFKPTEPGDLKLKKGDLVKVLHVGEHGYYEGRRETGEEGWFPCSTVEEINLNSRRRRACSVGDLDSDTEYFQRKTIKQHTSLNHMERSFVSDYAPRAVVLRKGPNGFGFVLRGAKGDSPGFRHPPNDAPAMQYLDTVDKGSVADKAGLKGGDFILEINGQNVTRASHEYVVNLIKSSGNTLTMNVLTVKPTERDQNWYVHQDGSMTLPHRRKQAPEPPQRDPNTSLSFSKAKSKSFAEGMAEIEKLDQTLAEYEVSDTPSGESAYSSGPKSNGAEMKTASIRAGYAKKRVSSVELENLCRSESPHKPEHLSPSEVRIKKYHKKQSNLEKSQSTPNLAQNLEEQQPDATSVPNASQPMYRTVASSGPSDYSPYSSSCSSGPGKYTQHLHPVPYMGNLPNVLPVMDVSGCRHSVAIGPNVQVNSLPSHARGKARPVAPPVVGQTNAPTKQPAPAPPPQVVKISTNKEQPVYASVINGAVNPTRQTPQGNPYESSFRPGTVAMFGNKKPMVTQSSLNQVKLRSSKQNDGQNEKPAQHAMLVTADVHASSEVKDKQKRDAQQSYYEPEPDYDSEHEDDVSKQPQMINGNSSYKTVISVSKSAAPPTTNGYVIPPAPAIGANNPIYSIPQQMHSHAMPSALPPPDQISLGVGTPINMMPAKSPSSSSSSSYKSTTEIRAPTPPPAPPLPSDLNSQLIPPPPQFCPPPPAAFAKSPASETSNEFLSEIKRAAIERMNRSKDIDAKDKTQVEQSSKKSTPMDKNQAAILEAVAKRRTMLEQNDKDIVVNQIEAQIQKAKKIQSAKYYNSGNGVKKEIEVFSENKDLLKEKSASIPPVPASKPLKQAATVAKPSARPVAPTKPKVVMEKVQSKPPAPNSISTIAITSPTLTKDAKTPSPTSTLIGSKNATAEKTMLVEADKLKESVKTVTTSTKVSEKAKASETTKSNDNGTDSGEEDFLKKAEKARQRYLQRRSGGAANDKPAHQNTATPAVSTVSVTATNHKTVSSSSSSTTITVLNANGEAEKMEQTSGTNKKIQKTNKTNLVQTKKTAAAPVMKPQLSNGNTKSNRKYIEIQSAGNLTAIDKIGNVSIKDRIASLQKQNGQQSNSPDLAKLITLKGVTTSHSHTDPFNSSDSCSTPNDSPYHVTNIVAPPPGFSDTEQSTPVETLNSLPHLQVLPAPLSELSISTVPPYDRPTDNLVPQDDSLSLISSLSTLSTLSTSSTEHPIEIVPPPPSGFEDKASPVSTDQGFEESFISPPPQFDSSMKNAASTKNSFRNKPVEDWFYVDVLDWLESVQMNQYKVNFANHCIDGKKLLNLKRNDYITLGVTQVGHRMNLERSIKKLAMATQQKTQH